jgi:hypothetical protein
VVGLLDTAAPQPPVHDFSRSWNYYHGSVADARANPLEISVFGYASGDLAVQRSYPWLGFRPSVIGNL